MGPGLISLYCSLYAVQRVILIYQTEKDLSMDKRGSSYPFDCGIAAKRSGHSCVRGALRRYGEKCAFICWTNRELTHSCGGPGSGNGIIRCESFPGCPPKGQNHFFLLKKKISGSGLRKKKTTLNLWRLSSFRRLLQSDTENLLRRCRSLDSDLPVFLLELTPPGWCGFAAPPPTPQKRRRRRRRFQR